MEPPDSALLGDAQRLRALHALGVVGSPPEEDFDRLTRLAARTLRVPLAMVCFVDAASVYVKSASGLPEPYATQRSIPQGVGLCLVAYARDEPTTVADLRAGDDFRDNVVVRDFGMGAYAGVPLRSSQGERLGTFCVYDRETRQWTTDDLLLVQDLAAAVMTEIELRESEARYRRLVDLSPEPIAVHCAGSIVYVNDAALKLVGAQDRGQVVGRRMLDFVHPDYRSLVLARVQRTQHERREAEATHEKFLRLDGVAIDVEVVAIPTTYSGAPATQVVLRDVSEQRRAERAMRLLADAGRALSSSLDLGRTIEAAARVAVPALADWCAVSVNAFGTFEHFAAHRDPTRERALRAALTPDVLVCEGGTEGTPRNGAEWARARGYALDDPPLRQVLSLSVTARGERVGTVLLAREAPSGAFEPADVRLAEQVVHSSSQAVENALLYLELSGAVRLRDDLLAAASHDLRTPLAAIRARAELLRRRAERGRVGGGSDLVDGLSRIERSVARMSRLIDQLLDAASVQMGHAIALEPRETDLLSLVQPLVDELRQTARTHSITLHAPAEALRGNWDGPRLERVVENLLANAVKYSPEGGEIDVRLGSVREAGRAWAELCVEDRGVGIPPDELRLVFDAYFRASNVAQHFRGSGLGLAICKHIVEGHGGRIEARAREGGGTAFVVRLPLGAGENASDG